MLMNPVRFLLVPMLLCGSALAATVDELVSDLGGTDEVARAQARQLLPREGYAAAEKVLPLLSSADSNVWWAARNVLADIGGELSTPGLEQERARLARLYMTLVAPEQPEAVKIRGLDLLMPVVPKDFEVGPIAALLDDPTLRERALAALEGIGSTQACGAMTKALRKADPDFQCALLNALGRCRDGLSLRHILRQTQSDDPRVRAAAARAVAWTADPDLVEDLRRVRGNADEATRFEATDALLRLADAMAQAGKIREALAVFSEVMDDPDPVSAGAALAGLIRYGDESVAVRVSDALSGERRAAFAPVALSALETAPDGAANGLLLAVYSAAPPDLRPVLIRIMGRKRDASFLDAFKQAGVGPDPALRQAALEALADMRTPAAAELLRAAAPAYPEAVPALQRVAETSRDEGDKALAGFAFMALYEAAGEPEAKRVALENLVKNPVPEATDSVLAALSRGELPSVTLTDVGRMAQTLSETGHKEEAGRVAAALAQAATTTETVQVFMQVAQSVGGFPGFASSLGFVTDWKVAGPFSWDPAKGFGPARVNEPAVDLTATYNEGASSIAWKPQAAAEQTGLVDLGSAFGDAAGATAYAFARVNVPEDTDAVIRAGSDDGIKIWLNGQAVHENLVDRGVALDNDQIPVKLKAGANDILVQITQGGGGWGYCLRLTKPDGTPLPFTQE